MFYIGQMGAGLCAGGVFSGFAAVNWYNLAVSWSMWRWIFVLGGYVMGNDTGCAEFLVGTPRGFEE